MHRWRLLRSFLLALLLPLAQLAAVAHDLSHVRAAIDAGSKSTPANAHCDLCVVAAAIAGGGAPASTPTLLLADIGTDSPAAQLASAPGAAPTFAFLSRAPPASLR
jgi:hypothetical protein